MIKFTRHNREWINAEASMEEALVASEALPLDDPGQPTLLARAQAYALLSIATSIESAGSLTEGAGSMIESGLDSVATALAGPQR